MNKVDLRNTFQQHMELWGLKQSSEAFFTHSSMLCAVHDANKEYMLKIVDKDDDEKHAAKVISVMGSDCTVRVEKAIGPVMLLEMLHAPAEQQTLSEMVENGEDDKATKTICSVVKAIHSKPVEKFSESYMTPFADRTDDIKAFLKSDQKNSEISQQFQLALELADELCSKSQSTRLIHGDIHHGNVMPSARGWLAIDPKGLFGPVEYEMANTLCNPFDQESVITSEGRLEKQAKIVSKELDFNFRILVGFAYVHAMHCASWCTDTMERDRWLALGKIALANYDVHRRYRRPHLITEG